VKPLEAAAESISAATESEAPAPPTIAAPVPHTYEEFRAAAPARPPPRPPGISASGWLAENGLAWLGGGGLVLGGLFLAVYAAQRGVFTPPFRIIAALIAGALMIAASEWIRRRPETPTGRHMLASSVSAGAAAAALRLWGYAGLAALAGTSLWSLEAMLHRRPADFSLLLVLQVVLPLAGVAWRDARDGHDLQRPLDAFRVQPIAALVISSALSLALWERGGLVGGSIGFVDGVLVCALLVFLGGAAVRIGRAPSAIFVVP
jgi:uncharacterized membrane protein